MLIGPGTHLVSTRIGHSVIVEGPPLTLIDTGMSGSLPRITRALRKLGRSIEDVGQILITHAHVDHIGCAREIKGLSGAKVLIHADDEAVASGNQEHYPPGRFGVTGLLGRPFERQFAKSSKFEPVGIDAHLIDGETLDPGLRVIATPGHTPGHCSLLISESLVLHVGDAIFNLVGMFPPPGIANQDQMAVYHSIRTLAGYSFRRISFGHGTPVMKSAERKLGKLARRYFPAGN